MSFWKSVFTASLIMLGAVLIISCPACILVAVFIFALALAIYIPLRILALFRWLIAHPKIGIPVIILVAIVILLASLES